MQIEYGSVLMRRVNRVFLVICGSVLTRRVNQVIFRSDWRHTVLARHAMQQNVVAESKNMKHVKSYYVERTGTKVENRIPLVYTPDAGCYCTRVVPKVWYHVLYLQNGATQLTHHKCQCVVWSLTNKTYEKFFPNNIVQKCQTTAKKTKKLIQVVLPKMSNESISKSNV